MSRATFRWCAASGGKGSAWHDAKHRPYQPTRSAAIGPGRLVLVVGPSGAGKDTLLGLAKAACADDRNIVFPRRVITREASASEDNEEVSAGTSRQALARGEYAMHWEAHGHRYALSRAIDDEIRAGRTVVANVSRTVIAAMRRAYANVVVVSITAPPNVLAERLAMRGAQQRRQDRAAAAAARSTSCGRARRDHRQCRQRRISRAPVRPHHQGREVGRVAEDRDVCHRDDRATRSDLRLSQRCLDGQGRRPRHAALSVADREVAVRGAGDLRAGGAGLLAARRSAGLRPHPRREDADDAGSPRQQPLSIRCATSCAIPAWRCCS